MSDLGRCPDKSGDCPKRRSRSKSSNLEAKLTKYQRPKRSGVVRNQNRPVTGPVRRSLEGSDGSDGRSKLLKEERTIGDGVEGHGAVSSAPSSTGFEPCDCSLKIREWMTTEDAATYLGVSVGSLRNMASNGQVPYHKLGRRNRYSVVELRQLLLSQKRGGCHGN